MLVPRIVHNVTRRIFPPAGHETTLQHEILPAGWMQSPWLALHFLHLFVGMCIPVITCTNNYITYIVAMWLYIVAMWLYFGRSRLQCEMAENQRVNSQTAEESQFKFWPAVTAVTMEVYGSDTPQVVSTVVSRIHAPRACWKRRGSLYAGSDILSREYAPSSGAKSRCWT